MREENAVREHVYNFWIMHADKGKGFTVKHFRDENIAKSTIYDIIRRCESGSGPARRIGSGRKPVKMNQTKVRLLKKLVDHKAGILQRRLAKKFNCSQQFISKTLRQKTTIKYKKRTVIPGRNDKHYAVIKGRCSYLYRNFKEKAWILDDESYFTLTNSCNNKNTGFYSSDVHQTPPDIKFFRKRKFEPKLLVWVAMSNKGLSKPYIVPANNAINSETYINKCLRLRLLPFINQHHNDQEYILA